MEGWLPLQDYPGYSASEFGQIRNDRRSSVLTIVKAETGHTYVGLMKNGVQVKRSVGKLIAETFVPKPMQSHFTTPIHLDGDLSNCYASNLLWRPKWFAMQFTQQFRKPQPYHDPVRDKSTGEVFTDCWPLVMTYGLLYFEILSSIVNSTYVFPTMQTFEWAY